MKYKHLSYSDRQEMEKAYEEAQAGTTVVLLIPARTDTAYFHDYIYGKAEIRFLRGRLHFEDEDGCTLRTRTGTGSRLHRFRRWSLSTTEIINA